MYSFDERNWKNASLISTNKYRRKLSHKEYYRKIKKKRKCGIKYKDNEVYLVYILLLCGGIEKNPGPINVTCPRCNQSFNRQSRLDLHISKSIDVSCQDCSKQFCSMMMLEQHYRTIHSGDGIINNEHSLNEAICPDSGHSKTSEYQDLINKHYDKIHSFVK